MDDKHYMLGIKEYTPIIIFQDGDTWALAHGITIAIISNKDLERLNNGEIGANDLKPSVEMGLFSMWPKVFDIKEE